VQQIIFCQIDDSFISPFALEIDVSTVMGTVFIILIVVAKHFAQVPVF
jgi:hypothetical protein